MTTTVSQAVAVRDKETKLVDWIRKQQDDIAMAAASHIKPSAIIRVTQGALRKNDKLMAAAIANPQSLLYALLDAARLGHEPDTDEYYLVPFGNEVTGIEGYKGIIERMYRARGVSSVVAEVVRQCDVYRRQGATTPPVHEFDEFADPEDRGPLRGVYAYAVMLDGRHSKVIAMGRAEVMRHKAMSKGSNKDDSPWNKWEESMWKKCPLRGLEPYVPTSSEYLAADGHARPQPPAINFATAPAALPSAPAPPPPAAAEDIVDAELVDDSGPAGPTADTAASSSRPASRGRGTRPTGAQLGNLGKLLARIIDPGETGEFLAWQSGRDECRALEALTRDEAQLVTTALEEAEREARGDTDQAAAALWAQYRRQRQDEAAEAQDAAGEPDGGQADGAE